MNRMQSGNMPSMAEIMSDPSLRELCVNASCKNNHNTDSLFTGRASSEDLGDSHTESEKK